MAKLIIVVLMLSSLFLAIPNVYARKQQGPEPKTSWFQSICQGKEKVAKVHFYVQDILGGENVTVYEVANASITSTSPTSFGQVRVLDDLLTAEPNINSQEVGRVQGLITSADLKTSALAMNLNFVFTAGEFNGSTISILGRNQIMDTERELPVAGGTGKFRFGRGYALTSTYSYDPITNYGVLEYTIYVTYVDESTISLFGDM
ncbi:hypothetical protein BUALT_Bualt15G0012700 [Buddleja alternifolia]|uniref:Dirigent protein n=1 Tax=Buddleja alternifolia TaxID=168488 RepID=A0AAV6W9N3_9LAMI|nr:hypothetical protein BUALT_Bualt15G0012700 [Buddleja alternifolia]